MVKDKKERLKELLAKQKQKELKEEEKREYETVLKEVHVLFPNIVSEEEVEILSKEDSKKIKEEIFYSSALKHVYSRQSYSVY